MHKDPQKDSHHIKHFIINNRRLPLYGVHEVNWFELLMHRKIINSLSQSIPFYTSVNYCIQKGTEFQKVIAEHGRE